MLKHLLKTLLLLSLTCPVMAKENVAVFAGGCFWCMQPAFDKVPGVVKTVVGFTGGRTKNPTYKQVSAGNTGHVEAIAVYYNPAQVGYKKLLQVFWHNIDPSDNGGQFCDRGASYRALIFTASAEQDQLARSSRQALIDSKKFAQVVTAIKAYSKFYPAETYHQNYYKKNPIRYKYYRYRCGRDARLKQLWGASKK